MLCKTLISITYYISKSLNDQLYYTSCIKCIHIPWVFCFTNYSLHLNSHSHIKTNAPDIHTARGVGKRLQLCWQKAMECIVVRRRNKVVMWVWKVVSIVDKLFLQGQGWKTPLNTCDIQWKQFLFVYFWPQGEIVTLGVTIKTLPYKVKATYEQHSETPLTTRSGKSCSVVTSPHFR